MELIYLYIEDVGRPFLRHTDFHFGAGFEAKYDRDAKKLNIRKKSERYPSLYGERIRSLDLIVGKNGAGKSTIMNLLGLPWRQRTNLFPRSVSDLPDDLNHYRWFALYHLQEDLFALEGYWFREMFPDVEAPPLNPDYGVYFRYDVDKQNPKEVDWLQNYEILDSNAEQARDLQGDSLRGNSALLCVLYQTPTGIDWLYEPPPGGADDDAPSAFFPRFQTARVNYSTVARYLYDAMFSSGGFGMFPLLGCAVWVSCRCTQNWDALLEFVERSLPAHYLRWKNLSGHPLNFGEVVAKNLIYDNWANELARNAKKTEPPSDAKKTLAQALDENLHRFLYSAKKRMILSYLEEIILYLYQDVLKSAGIWKETAPYLSPDDKKTVESSLADIENELNPITEDFTEARAVPPERSYSERKDYLLKRIRRLNELDINQWEDYEIAEKMVEGLEKIPEHFFRHDEKLEIRLSDMRGEEGNFLLPLMEAQDLNRNPLFRERHSANHAAFLSVGFQGLSAGEAHFVDFYAALYATLRKFSVPEGHAVLLLLDEPDGRFHPEWSRRFIWNLKQLLNPPDSDDSEAANVFRRYRYQAVITSHSPLLMSDVSSGRIQCIYRSESGADAVQIRQSRYGFMSSLNDTLKDSFFVDSVFGELAVNYVKGLIEQISEIENKLDNAESSADAIERMEREALDVQEQLQIIQDDVIYLSLSRRLERVRQRIEIHKRRTEGGKKGGDAS